MNNKYTSPILLSCLMSILILSNCIKKAEFEGYGAPEYLEGGFRTPLLNSSLTLGDAISTQTEGSGLIEASDKSYYFSYQDSVVTDNAETLINFETVTSNQKIKIPGSPLPVKLPDDTTINYTYDLQFDDIVFNSDVTLLYLLLKDGLINLDVNTQFNQKLTYKITIGNIINTANSNAPLIIQDSIIYSDTEANSQINLDKYKIVMNEAGVPTTSIKAKLELTIKSSGQIMPTTDTDLNFNFSLNNLKFKRLVGQIKSLTFPTSSQTTQINVFNNDIINKIKFADPQVKFTFENSLGVPINVDLGQIEALKGGSSVKLNYTSNDSLPVLKLGYPDTTKFGQTVKSSVTINNQNCTNLIDFLYSAPDRLKYSINGTIGSNTGYHFIEDISKVKVKYELKVPIYGEIDKMSISKTIGYKFPDTSMVLDTLEFLTNINNHVPLNVKVQIYLTDGDTTNILDSLFYSPNPLDEMNVFEAATNIDANGRAQTPTRKKTYIKRTTDWYNKVATKTRFLIVVGTFYTPKGKNVKFFSDEAVDVNVSWRGKGKYRIDVK